MHRAPRLLSDSAPILCTWRNRLSVPVPRGFDQVQTGTRQYSGKQTSERNRSWADKTKGESGRIVQFVGERILALAEYCSIAQAERPDQFVTPNGVRLHRRRQNFPTLDALKRLKYFANVATSRLNRSGPLFRMEFPLGPGGMVARPKPRTLRSPRPTAAKLGQARPGLESNLF